MADTKICLRILYDHEMCSQDDLLKNRQQTRIMLISSLERGDLIGFCIFKDDKLTKIIIDENIDFKGKINLTEEKIWSLESKYYYNIRFIELYQAENNDIITEECLNLLLEQGFKEYPAYLVMTYIGNEIEI